MTDAVAAAVQAVQGGAQLASAQPADAAALAAGQPTVGDADRFSQSLFTVRTLASEGPQDAMAIAPPTAEPGTVNVGDRILEGMARLDSQFRKLVPDGIGNVDIDTSGFGLPSAAQGIASANGKGSAHTEALIELLGSAEKMHMSSIRFSVWTVNFNMLTTGVSKGTKGVETLFRNQAG